MKKLIAILAAIVLSVSVSFPANAEVCDDDPRYISQERECYGLGVAVGILIGGAVVGAIAVAALAIHHSSSNPPGTVVSFNERQFGIENDSQFFLKPDIDLESDRKFGWNTGIQW